MTRPKDRLYSKDGWKKLHIARLADRIAVAEFNGAPFPFIRDPPPKKRRGGQPGNHNASRRHAQFAESEALEAAAIESRKEVEKLARIVEMAERLEQEGVPRAEIAKRIERLSTALGLTQMLKRKPRLSPPAREMARDRAILEALRGLGCRPEGEDE